MELINVMVNKLASWIDNIIKLFGFYSERFPTIIIYIFLFVFASKVFKFKLNYTKSSK